MHSFTYEFEELPLAIVNGIPAAMINGCAEIEYWPGGEWEVLSLYVEGHQDISREERTAGENPWVYVPASRALDHIIADRLEREWHDKVSSAVFDQLEKDRASAAADRADIINARRVEAA